MKKYPAKKSTCIRNICDNVKVDDLPKSWSLLIDELISYKLKYRVNRSMRIFPKSIMAPGSNLDI